MNIGDDAGAEERGSLEHVETSELVEPGFAIEAEGKWYVVVSALEYDPAKAQNDQQRAGIARIAELCSNAASVGKVVRIVADARLSGQASDMVTPVKPRPRPGGGGG